MNQCQHTTVIIINNNNDKQQQKEDILHSGLPVLSSLQNNKSHIQVSHSIHHFVRAMKPQVAMNGDYHQRGGLSTGTGGRALTSSSKASKSVSYEIFAPRSQTQRNRLAELQSAAFAPPGENQYKIKPGVVVHCWSGMIQASPARAASWWACNSGTKAAQSYTEAVLELAMQKKGCPASKRDTFGRFSQCFANKGMPDDPTLQEGFLALTEAWKKQREPGADLLSDARKALDAASKGGDAESLLRARRAVLAFGGQQRALRDIVRKGTAFAKDAREASSKDASVIATQLDSWRADITAQETNYVGLLEQLTAISAPATAPAS